MGERKGNIALLLTISVIIRIILLFINKNPCLYDECLYGKVLDEMMKKGSFVPTYFDRYVPWKPPLTFYVYMLFYPLSNILPIELTLRIPSTLFGVLTTIAFYFFVLELLKEDKDREKIALYASIAYSAHPALLITNGLFLTDNLLAFLTILSLLYYLKGERNCKYFLFAGFLSALAFFTKTIMALVIPYLAISYYFLKDRKMLFKKEFIFSLLFIPATFLLMHLSFGEEFLHNFIIDAERVEPPYVEGLYTLLFFIAFSVPFVIFFANWIADRIKKGKLGLLEKFSLVWIALLYPATFSNQLLYWYFIPVIPPILILGIKEMSKGIFDIFFIMVFACMILIILSIPYAALFGIDKRFEDQRNVGLYLANKSNILLLTGYSPGIIYYKFHDENESHGFSILFTQEHIDEELEDILNHRLDQLEKTDYIKALYGPTLPKKYLFYGSFEKFDHIVIEDAFVKDKFKIDEIFSRNGYKIEKQIGIYTIYGHD